MEASDVRSAVSAATAIAAALGLRVDDALVLQNSNRIAVRLTPCDVLVRVAPVARRAGAEFEVDVARRLTDGDSAMAGLETRVQPRVYVRDGFATTFWRYYEPIPVSAVAPAEYAQALERMHASMRGIDVVAPHFTDRVAEAQELVGNRTLTPALPDADRELLSVALRTLRQAIVGRGAPEQLLHGEPHPGNLLQTKNGLLFVDLETCCRGPVEFDIAHAPEEVDAHYPGADGDLVADCRMLVIAMVASWRWDRNDQFPDGRRMGVEMLDQLRAAIELRRFDDPA